MDGGAGGYKAELWQAAPHWVFTSSFLALEVAKPGGLKVPFRLVCVSCLVIGCRDSAQGLERVAATDSLSPCAGCLRACAVVVIDPGLAGRSVVFACLFQT